MRALGDLRTRVRLGIQDLRKARRSGTRVFVFAPRGRILNLAKGATLADAVAHVVSEESQSDRRGALAYVNGQREDAEYELRNGDIVSFGASSLPFAKTTLRREGARVMLTLSFNPTLADTGRHELTFTAQDSMEFTNQSTAVFIDDPHLLRVSVNQERRFNLKGLVPVTWEDLLPTRVVDTTDARAAGVPA